MDVSEYSAVEMDGNEHIKDGRDGRWMRLTWAGPHYLVDENFLRHYDGAGPTPGRYVLTVDPDSGDIIFVDEEDDVRQVIDARNLGVLVKRSERIKTREQIGDYIDHGQDPIHIEDHYNGDDAELMPYIRREGEIGVRIDTTMEQLHSLYIALKFYLDVRGNHEVPEWVEQLGRFFNDG